MMKAGLVVGVIILSACSSPESIVRSDAKATYDMGTKSAKQVYECIDHKITGIPLIISRSFDPEKNNGSFLISQGVDALYVVEVEAPSVTLKQSKGIILDVNKRYLMKFLQECTS